MRAPSIDLDGWCLDDGELLHGEFPDSFWIPSSAVRRGLHPGCLAKLVFRMESKEEAQVERMWVVVTERTRDGEAYRGVLDNTPCFAWAVGRLETGFELPFEPRHVIAVDDPTDATMAIARATPARRWR